MLCRKNRLLLIEFKLKINMKIQKTKLTNNKLTRFRSDGSLTVHFGERDYHALKILPWSEGCQILVRRDKGWEYFDGVADFVLVNSAYDVFSDSAISIYGRCVPKKIKLKLSKFRHHQARMLQLISSHYFAADLFDNNPILLWMIIDWAYSNNISLAEIQYLILQKQIVILNKLYPNAKNKHLKLIKIVSLPLYDRQHIPLFLTVLSNLDLFSQLSHCHKLNKNILDVFGSLDSSNADDHKNIIAILKYYQNNGKNNLHDILTTYNDCLRMHSDLYIEDSIPFLIKRNYSVADVYKYHDKLVDEYNKRAEELAFKEKHPNGYKFPKPFLPGNNNIIHISDYSELIDEGRLMQSCVATYGEEIMNGYSCIYKVLHPHRATLELIHVEGAFKINQFKMKLNNEPTNEAYRFVRKWLQDEIRSQG